MTAQPLTVPVTGIQRFCMHDGPGIRTTVFFKGCPLRCRWCHNPETQSTAQQIFYTDARCVGCGACAQVCRAQAHDFREGHAFIRERCTACGACTEVCPTHALERACVPMSVDEILETVMRDRAFYGANGGLTLSGGEPMMHPQAALALLRGAHERGLNTAVETCGFFSSELLEELVPVTDLFLWDFKDSDPERHRQNTGVSPEPILENLRRADALGAAVRLRCILIQGVNYTGPDCAHIQAIAHLRGELRGCVGVDLLPYHPMGDSKCRRLGIPYWGGREYIPDRAELQALARQLQP